MNCIEKEGGKTSNYRSKSEPTNDNGTYLTEMEKSVSYSSIELIRLKIRQFMN
jgi:hypothetical protein